MKVIIPMAGLGSRFSSQGYTDPKPFINVNGKPMIRQVVDHLNLHEYEHIFICNSSHLEQFDMAAIFPDIKFSIVRLDTTLEGAACSVAMADMYMQDDEDFIIVNSDQLLFYDNTEVERVRLTNIDGCIWCFLGEGNNWSYVRVNYAGQVLELAEKRRISGTATAGMYYWRSWSSYITSLNKMILVNDRVNNEFYAAPVYNYLDGRIEIRMVDKVEQLGTPEELKEYEHKISLHRNN